MHFAGIYFRELILIFVLISLFYADFGGISEKSTFGGYLISRNQQKFVFEMMSSFSIFLEYI